MRVTAAACLVSAGLIACVASPAVAAAEPEGTGDGPGSSTGRASAGESAARLGRSAQTSPRSVTRPRTASSAPRVPALPARSVGDPAEEYSKLPQVGAQAETPLEDLPGEPATDPAASKDPTGDPGESPVVEDPEDDCGGWWLSPPLGELPASSAGDGYDGGLPSVAQPPVLPAVPEPADDLLPESSPVPPAVLDAPLPVSALPPVLPGIGAGAAGGGDRGARAGVPRESAAPPAEVPERPVPARDSDAAAVPASYRAGYGEYLRTAGMTQVAAVAVPGAAAIMLLTGAGGVIGYRQARAGHAIRASAVGRFSS